ncbi:hypothetical protein MC885_021752, partial [Smutsia gigantea]
MLQGKRETWTGLGDGDTSHSLLGTRTRLTPPSCPGRVPRTAVIMGLQKPPGQPAHERLQTVILILLMPLGHPQEPERVVWVAKAVPQCPPAPSPASLR